MFGWLLRLLGLTLPGNRTHRPLPGAHQGAERIRPGGRGRRQLASGAGAFILEVLDCVGGGALGRYRFDGEMLFRNRMHMHAGHIKAAGAKSLLASYKRRLCTRVFSLARPHARDDANIYSITHEDIASVLFELRQSSGMREFKFELIDFAARLTPKSKYLEMLTTVVAGAGRDQFLYTRRKAAQVIAQIAPQIDDREILTAAITEIEARGPEVLGTSRREWDNAVAALIVQSRGAHVSA